LDAFGRESAQIKQSIPQSTWQIFGVAGLRVKEIAAACLFEAGDRAAEYLLTRKNPEVRNTRIRQLECPLVRRGSFRQFPFGANTLSACRAKVRDTLVLPQQNGVASADLLVR